MTAFPTTFERFRPQWSSPWSSNEPDRADRQQKPFDFIGGADADRTRDLLSTIPGVKQVAAAAILAEIGTDMSWFPSTADLDSWAGMAPGNNQSGGKRHCAKARKGNRWLRTMLVESGNAAGRTRNTALSALYRRMIVRGGRKHAAFVVGRHILNIGYHLLRERSTYRELGPTYFEQRRVEQLKRRCLDQLQNLGFEAKLIPLPKAA